MVVAGVQWRTNCWFKAYDNNVNQSRVPPDQCMASSSVVLYMPLSCLPICRFPRREGGSRDVTAYISDQHKGGHA